MRRALAASVAAHGLLALWLVALGLPWPRARDPDPPGATAQMIFTDPGRDGSGPPPPAPAPAPQPTPPAAIETRPPEPSPSETSAPEPIPPTPAPTPPMANTSALEAAPPPPEVRLDDPDPAGSTAFITSDDIPVGPDPTAPNIPPRYPPRAVRGGEEGTVVLQVAVSPDGDAAAVDVYLSSGFASLDRAARDAVAHWRFVPKTDGRRPVPSRTLVRIRFRLD